MYNFVECVRFNELEIGDIFDYRTQQGIFYQVVNLTPEKVYYRPVNGVFQARVNSDFRTSVGVVGLYEEKEVLNG